MNVCLCSAFRNAMPYLDRYIDQINKLEDALIVRGDHLQLIWGEGDSTDGTLAELHRMAFGATIVDCTHGGKEFGSVVDSQRFKQLAYVGNRILGAVPTSADAVIWAESDLIWEPSTMLRLIDRTTVYPAIAPLCLLRREGYPENAFYDTWAFRKHGRHFTQFPPYFRGFDFRQGHAYLVDSAGSCLAMKGDIARQVHFTEDEVFVGLSKQIYQCGGGVYVDPNCAVYHE